MFSIFVYLNSSHAIRMNVLIVIVAYRKALEFNSLNVNTRVNIALTYMEMAQAKEGIQETGKVIDFILSTGRNENKECELLCKYTSMYIPCSTKHSFL